MSRDQETFLNRAPVLLGTPVRRIITPAAAAELHRIMVVLQQQGIPVSVLARYQGPAKESA